MDLNFFTDMLDALEKVGTWLKKLKGIPKNERDKYHQVIDETYRLMDTVLNMIIFRLNDILLNNDEKSFLDEVKALNYENTWVQAERGFRLCQSLRRLLQDAQELGRNSLFGQSIVRGSSDNWNVLLYQMKSILTAEQRIACYISEKFDNIAHTMRVPNINVANIKKEVEVIRDALIKERQKFIQQEVQLYTII